MGHQQFNVGETVGLLSLCVKKSPSDYVLVSKMSFHLQFNFVGRILGPRGMTAKELEQYTGCKIMVRGKGSMRDKKKVSFASSEIQLNLSIADPQRIEQNWCTTLG